MLHGMHGGCGGVSADDGRYGEAGEVKVHRNKEVQHAKLKHKAHHGEWVRGMVCMKCSEAITG